MRALVTGGGGFLGRTIVEQLRAAGDDVRILARGRYPEVEALGVSLCCDPAVAAAHMEALQAFDMIAQKQRGLAALLRADCPVSALAALGLDELKLRLGSPFDRP